MRRDFLTVRANEVDVDAVKAEIEEIAALFGEYLSEVQRSGSGSKHRQMGAVAKALQHARNGARGAALKGYARRVHEQTVRTTFPIGPIEKLDEGLSKLDALLTRRGMPTRELADILKRIDYATYYEVKRRMVERYRLKNQRWDAFVRDNADRLELNPADIADLKWFSERKLRDRGDKWNQAVEEFKILLKKDPAIDIVDDEEEEEEAAQ